MNRPAAAYMEVNLCGMKRMPDGSYTALEHRGESADLFSVYVIPRAIGGDIADDPIFDEDFSTLEAASAAYDEQVRLHPDCEENIYSMPD